MDFKKQKSLLKKLRAELRASSCELHVEFAGDLIEQINTLIGRINCYSTDDDLMLEKLAKQDGIHND